MNRTRDALAALVVGGLVFLLALTALATPMQSRLTPFFAENSATLAKGRNIVNVILVDSERWTRWGRLRCWP